MEPAGRVQNTSSRWENPAGGPMISEIARVTLTDGRGLVCWSACREGRGAGKSTTPGGSRKACLFLIRDLLMPRSSKSLRQGLYPGRISGSAEWAGSSAWYADESSVRPKD